MKISTTRSKPSVSSPKPRCYQSGAASSGMPGDPECAMARRRHGLPELAGPANVGSDLIDSAGDGFPDLAIQCTAAIAVAAHAGLTFVHEFRRDQVEFRIVLDGEARPVARIRAAGAAGLARAGVIAGGGSRHAAPCSAIRHRPPAGHASVGRSHASVLRQRLRNTSRRSGYFSSRYSAVTARSVRKLRKSLRSSHQAASRRTASR